MAYVWYTVPSELAETLTAIVDEYTMRDDPVDKANLIHLVNRAIDFDENGD